MMICFPPNITSVVRFSLEKKGTLEYIDIKSSGKTILLFAKIHAFFKHRSKVNDTHASRMDSLQLYRLSNFVCERKMRFYYKKLNNKKTKTNRPRSNVTQ